MYLDYTLSWEELDPFRAYIPDSYLEQLKWGELTATATYEEAREDDRLVGVVISAENTDWFEIVYVYMGSLYEQDVQVADFLRHVIHMAEQRGRFCGAFMEVHMDKLAAVKRDILMLAGMELREAKSNNFELTLGDVSDAQLLYSAARGADGIYLEDASEWMLDEILDRMESDERPVPVAAELEWEDYDSRISNIYVEEDGDEPRGLLLISEQKDYLVLDLCYGDSIKAVPAMIGMALYRALEIYPYDQKVLIPIVGEEAEKLVGKIAPMARRGTILQAVTWFEERQLGKSMQYVMRQITRG